MILPIMLVLLLTVADFGRLFATGISLESAARAAAETAAGAYLAELRTSGGLPPLTTAAYDRVHKAAWQSICDEASRLPNATPGSGGSQCSDLPTLVCVHDSGDPGCATIYNAGGGGTTGCPQVAAATDNAPVDPTSTVSATVKYVEVRICYRFSTILPGINIPFLGGTLSPLSGNFFLERVRTFTVADY
jgi:hypothetical protein